MKIPKSVKILGREYSVMLTDDAELLGGCWGKTDLNADRIWIKKALLPGNRLAVLLHEVDETLLALAGEEYDHAQFMRITETRFATYRDNNFCFCEKHK